MRPVFWSLLIVCLGCGPPALCAQEGRLQRVREAAAGDDSAGKQEKKESSRRAECEDEDEGGLGSLFGTLLAEGLLAPFVLPHAWLGDDYGRTALFLRHPYQDDLPGFMRPEGLLKESQPPGQPELDPARLKPWMGRLALQESNDSRGLNRLNGELLLDTDTRFGLRTGWTYLYERLGGGRHDDLVLGDLNLTFRFAQNDYVQMRAGLGARLLAGGGARHWGFNFTYGADVFPVRPLVLSAVVDLGTLGEATFWHARVSAGVIFRGWEAFAGFDHMQVGAVPLQGPTVGLRFWF